MKKFYSNIGCDEKYFSNLKIITNQLKWDGLTSFDCMIHPAWVFFVFQDLQADIVFIRDNKRGKNFKPPHLHQKRLHYSRFLHDYILQLEDVIKRPFHSQLLSLLTRGVKFNPNPPISLAFFLILVVYLVCLILVFLDFPYMIYALCFANVIHEYEIPW